MCYMIRQTQSEPERGGTTLPPSFDRLRARWVGAVAAALIGGLALAALVAPASSPPRVNAKQPEVLAPIAVRTPAVPVTGVVEQTSVSVDDGVPSTTSDVAKAGLGHCEHGL